MGRFENKEGTQVKGEEGAPSGAEHCGLALERCKPLSIVQRELGRKSRVTDRRVAFAPRLVTISAAWLRTNTEHAKMPGDFMSLKALLLSVPAYAPQQSRPPIENLCRRLSS